uniref:Serpentine receptor class gamma n=1 Tax=Acrobeloides nanus TaxID=290746 RepID=A0A914DVQ6_9BILA
MVTYIYINRMSIGSLLPLAINRFFRLYFDHYYDRFFGGFKLFIFLFGYDLVLCIYAHIQTLFPYNNNLEIAFCVSIMSLSIVMAIGILFKIRQMNKLAKKSIDTSTLKDLQRAAIVCFVQGIALCIYFSLVSISQSFYLRIVTQPNETPNILFRIVLVLYPFYTFMYLTSMLIDAILLLLVLKTYRTSLIGMLKKIPYINKKKSVILVSSVNIQTHGSQTSGVIRVNPSLRGRPRQGGWGS